LIELVENAAFGAGRVAGENTQNQTRREKPRRANPGDPGQSVGCCLWRSKTAHAATTAANTKPPAFRPLQKDKADNRSGEDHMDDKDNGVHVFKPYILT